MKKLICILASIIALGCTGQERSKGKILVTYFSWGGNTREIAKQIQEQTGGDLFEIVMVNPYSSDYNKCVEQARKEQQDNARPEFTGKVKDMETYDVIFVGYPNWCGSMPMVLFTFLEQYDLSGKTIIPFCTHGSGHWGRSVEDLKQLCPKSTVLEGFAVHGNRVKNQETKENLSKWLQEAGLR
ncbi:MAG: NAD(P)H-dependent oxidoreductase [Bacteroidales bacterium]|jgi:flavodoxin|nr:NAD(P)H-dependent oxidoreductase [Bacteroidales bacterium]